MVDDEMVDQVRHTSSNANEMVDEMNYEMVDDEMVDQVKHTSSNANEMVDEIR